MAEDINNKLKIRVQKLKNRGINPNLAIILVGDNQASKIFIKNKQRSCTQIGMRSSLYEYPENISESKLIDLVEKLNKDKNIHGIIVQLPLPKHIKKERILDRISPEKDVDGLNNVNLGNLINGDEFISPCTPKGIIKMFDEMKIPVVKKDVVIVNNSIVVGKPLGIMLTNRYATVTLCHKKTRYLKQHTKRADILITATGVPNLIKKNMVKKGVVIIDTGISYKQGKINGDVDFENVKEIASYITPVPGGVGPMTVAMVLQNTVILAEKFGVK